MNARDQRKGSVGCAKRWGTSRAKGSPGSKRGLDSKDTPRKAEDISGMAFGKPKQGRATRPSELMGNDAYTEAIHSFLRKTDIGKVKAEVLDKNAGQPKISWFGNFWGLYMGGRFAVLYGSRFPSWFVGLLTGCGFFTISSFSFVFSSVQ